VEAAAGAEDGADGQGRGGRQVHPMDVGLAAFWCGRGWSRWRYNALRHSAPVSSSTGSCCWRLRGAHPPPHVEPNAAASPSMSWLSQLEMRLVMPEPPPAVVTARSLEILWPDSAFSATLG
jgi:hypothetical protein